MAQQLQPPGLSFDNERVPSAGFAICNRCRFPAGRVPSHDDASPEIHRLRHLTMCKVERRTTTATAFAPNVTQSVPSSLLCSRHHCWSCQSVECAVVVIG